MKLLKREWEVGEEEEEGSFWGVIEPPLGMPLVDRLI
jgi:hypothetical protein